MNRRGVGAWGWMGFLVLAACASDPPQSPTRYQEDFAGDAVPFDIHAEIADSQVILWLQPGHCRRIAYDVGLPPRVVEEYPCRYSVANTRVGLALPDGNGWRSMTGPRGVAVFFIPDEVALRLHPNDSGIVYVGKQAVGPVPLGPVLEAAVSRLAPPRYAYVPPPDPVTPAPPRPASYPPVAETPASRTRPWTPGELAFLSLGVCAAKKWAGDTCEEKIKMGELGVAICSAGMQYLQDQRITLGSTMGDVAKSRAAKDSDFWKAVFAVGDLVECFFEIQPRITAASRSGELPPIPI